MDDFIPKQENNNDDKEEPICIDDDSMSIGAVSASKMPLLGTDMHNKYHLKNTHTHFITSTCISSFNSKRNR